MEIETQEKAMNYSALLSEVCKDDRLLSFRNLQRKWKIIFQQVESQLRVVPNLVVEEAGLGFYKFFIIMIIVYIQILSICLCINTKAFLNTDSIIIFWKVEIKV